MKILIALCATSALLAGCGGGGDSSPEAAPAPSPLAAYAGVWQSDCDHRGHETLTFTPGANGTSLEVSSKSEYFSGVDCTGNVLLTMTSSANSMASYTGTVDASVQLSADSTPSAIKVDKVSTSSPALTLQGTGPAVVYSIKDGMRQWCFDAGNGSTVCSMDNGAPPESGIHPAATVAGGLYLRGNQLFLLKASGSSFVIDLMYTKK
ncbi:hypothetical protein [Janthinobacterium sp.]|uniref:hypothetical protein n=1 Tax=Janthinobacterium sp. TaxID=1871054 RepID=UPI00293D82CB|nr:hypothetical protein [Janthinobacterium sp.]